MAKGTVEGIYKTLLTRLNSSNAFRNPDTLTSSVKRALSDASSNTTTNSDNRRMKWEYLIKRDVFQHAMLEGKALASANKEEAEKYYQKLQDWLDLALVFTELGATEASYTFSVVQDLLETQTIPSCMKIFDWIERRSRDRTPSSTTSTTSSSSADLGSGRLTAGMQPQKGKALVLLRTLNDLLRRLSKAGGETIGFSGRILTYLSQVFPLGERSGVNLRGEYGPTWEMPTRETKDDTELAGHDGESSIRISPSSQVLIFVSVDFYSTFWSLQLPFSKPAVFASTNPPMTFGQFQDAVDKVLPVIKEATVRERAMMGVGRSASTMGSATLKRKRSQDEGMTTEKPNGKTAEYFFAKFLTSPELLDLELADTHFRRQILFQLLIVLNHLLTHTKAEKAKWVTTKNRSLHMPVQDKEKLDWYLDDAHDYTNTAERLGTDSSITRLTATSFASTVQSLLEREKGWIQWKNDLCDWTVRRTKKPKTMYAATRGLRAKMRGPFYSTEETQKDWPWDLGTEALTEIWAMGYRGLEDLGNRFNAGSPHSFLRQLELEDRRIEMRAKTLRAQQERRLQMEQDADVEMKSPEDNTASAVKQEALPQPSIPGHVSDQPSRASTPSRNSIHPSLPPKPGLRAASPGKAGTPVPTTANSTKTTAPAPALPALPQDEQLRKAEESKTRITWLALRTARDSAQGYLIHFNKIGAGDLRMLCEEIDKAEREKEKEKTDKSESSMDVDTGKDTESDGKVEKDKEEDSDPPGLGYFRAQSEIGQSDREGDVKME
ncbi:THO complex subunit 1 transcription elongation factor-domain-containing protein [Lentinula raphanica]|uniref:THO complex subunit 1 transcription elongation factor-domain-containing protein n=1 Tax=Lentinula raphanica TaxID=153919 RepID=A0AA38P0W5_9AGAR|nr:THO complex subunit 1 transcription elongation factor-domain-containing protein [Lentinula raphanica]